MCQTSYELKWPRVRLDFAVDFATLVLVVCTTLVFCRVDEAIVAGVGPPLLLTRLFLTVFFNGKWTPPPPPVLSAGIAAELALMENSLTWTCCLLDKAPGIADVAAAARLETI